MKILEISELKLYVQKFQTKDLRQLRYFLDIKVARSKKQIIFSQRKYVLKILSEVGMLGYKKSGFANVCQLQAAAILGGRGAFR